jgi:hypothetical protein
VSCFCFCLANQCGVDHLLMQFGDMVQPRTSAYIRAPPRPYSLTGLHFNLVCFPRLKRIENDKFNHLIKEKLYFNPLNFH